MKEEFKKMHDLLQSRDPSERELGLQLVRNYIQETKPCNILLEKGKNYKVTWLREMGSLKDIVQRIQADFEGRFTHYDNPGYVKYRTLRFIGNSIRSEDVLEIVPV